MNLKLGTVFEILETAGLDPYHIETSPLIYIDLRSRSMDWFLYDNGLRRERVKESLTQNFTVSQLFQCCYYLVIQHL